MFRPCGPDEWIRSERSEQPNKARGTEEWGSYSSIPPIVLALAAESTEILGMKRRDFVFSSATAVGGVLLSRHPANHVPCRTAFGRGATTTLDPHKLQALLDDTARSLG